MVHISRLGHIILVSIHAEVNTQLWPPAGPPKAELCIKPDTGDFVQPVILLASWALGN